MDFDQKRSLVFRVSRDKTGMWNVNEEGFEYPLASFDTSKDAREYALDIAKSNNGFAVKVFDEHNEQILLDADETEEST